MELKRLQSENEEYRKILHSQCRCKSWAARFSTSSSISLLSPSLSSSTIKEEPVIKHEDNNRRDEATETPMDISSQPEALSSYPINSNVMTHLMNKYNNHMSEPLSSSQESTSSWSGSGSDTALDLSQPERDGVVLDLSSSKHKQGGL